MTITTSLKHSKLLAHGCARTHRMFELLANYCSNATYFLCFIAHVLPVVQCCSLTQKGKRAHQCVTFTRESDLANLRRGRKLIEAKTSESRRNGNGNISPRVTIDEVRWADSVGVCAHIVV